MDIGLVGVGAWGKLILRDLRSLGCSVAAVARSAESRQRAHDGGASHVVDDVAGLPPCRGLIVATPTSTHADVLDECLERGVPIFCEKPLTNDSTRARTIVERAPDRVFVMDKWRYHPGTEELGRIARSGELGRPLGLKSQRLQWGCAHPDVDCLWTLMPHELSIGLEILGAYPEPRLAVAERADGKVHGLTAIGGAAPWHVMSMGARSPVVGRRIELQLERGVADLNDPYDDHVRIFRDGPDGEPERRAISTEYPLLRELRAFVGHLAGGPPPRTNGRDAARSVALIEQYRQLAGL